MTSPALLFRPQPANKVIPQDPFMDLPDPTATCFSRLTAHPFPLATPTAF